MLIASRVAFGWVGPVFEESSPPEGTLFEDLQDSDIDYLLKQAVGYYYEDTLTVPHYPTWITHTGNWEPPVDQGGLAILYIRVGDAVFEYGLDGIIYKLEIHSGDLVVFDDRMTHSYQTLRPGYSLAARLNVRKILNDSPANRRNVIRRPSRSMGEAAKVDSQQVEPRLRA